MPNQTLSLAIDAETPLEIRKADRAVQSLTGLSRRQIRGLFDHGCVILNGQPCHLPGRPLTIGDRVEVRYDTHRRYHPIGKAKSERPADFDVLYEDDHMIVVCKPAGWLTVPTAKREANTLWHRVSAFLSESTGGRYNRTDRTAKLQTVQRLDRGVSGVLVFAKTPAACEALREQFQRQKPERSYLAIVAGRVEPASGTFRSYLATNRDMSRYSSSDPSGGELAVTHFEVLRLTADAALVRVELETGRRHQIRAHFADIGHPVLGDDRYRPQLAEHPRWTARRLALHAAVLAFDHPDTGEPCRFEVPLPQEFEAFLRQAN